MRTDGYGHTVLRIRKKMLTLGLRKTIVEPLPKNNGAGTRLNQPARIMCALPHQPLPIRFFLYLVISSKNYDGEQMTFFNNSCREYAFITSSK